jgi:hypothetical protein
MITSGVKQHLSDQLLHPTYHCILFGPLLLPLPFWVHIRIILPLLVIHHFRIFYLAKFQAYSRIIMERYTTIIILSFMVCAPQFLTLQQIQESWNSLFHHDTRCKARKIYNFNLCIGTAVSLCMIKTWVSNIDRKS